jgi:hypothetical protein
MLANHLPSSELLGYCHRSLRDKTLGKYRGRRPRVHPAQGIAMGKGNATPRLRPNGPTIHQGTARITAGPLGRIRSRAYPRSTGRCPGLGEPRAFGPETLPDACRFRLHTLLTLAPSNKKASEAGQNPHRRLGCLVRQESQRLAGNLRPQQTPRTKTPDAFIALVSCQPRRRWAIRLRRPNTRPRQATKLPVRARLRQRQPARRWCTTTHRWSP